MKAKSITFVILLAVLSLSGCSSSGDDMAALQEYANAQVKRSGGPVEPLPEFISYEPFKYSAAALRGPFDVPVEASAIVTSNDSELVEPDLIREKEYLESFSVASLKMVGSMSGGKNLWVLIQDENAEIHEVMIGDYLGRNYGRIVTASSTHIDFIEIVPSGQGEGWIERPQSIKLDE